MEELKDNFMNEMKSLIDVKIVKKNHFGINLPFPVFPDGDYPTIDVFKKRRKWILSISTWNMGLFECDYYTNVWKKVPDQLRNQIDNTIKYYDMKREGDYISKEIKDEEFDDERCSVEIFNFIILLSELIGITRFMDYKSRDDSNEIKSTNSEG